MEQVGLMAKEKRRDQDRRNQDRGEATSGSFTSLTELTLHVGLFFLLPLSYLIVCGYPGSAVNANLAVAFALLILI